RGEGAFSAFDASFHPIYTSHPFDQPDSIPIDFPHAAARLAVAPEPSAGRSSFIMPAAQAARSREESSDSCGESPDGWALRNPRNAGRTGVRLGAAGRAGLAVARAGRRLRSDVDPGDERVVVRPVT